ncbi:hypothetical protein [Abyssisolibacter fermentans]|uniref:hypothetical protein n=1 Tax=Abyssisolibacter fermentans TaxID=1766203 RepID=UPI00083654EB|nr:hypothetical protein [Abyssisolibacter fermentans]
MIMKKFQSFDDVEKYLKTEEVYYEDKKNIILKNIRRSSTSNQRFIYNKIVFVTILLLISVTMVAFTFGYIPEHKDFVKEHNGDIKATLTDGNGNIVIQLGVMSDRDNYDKCMLKSQQREVVAEEFENITKLLKDKIPNDKVALFIPVKGLKSFVYFDILNSMEFHYTIKSIKNKIPINSPFPKYISKEYTFDQACIFYSYENFYKPYQKEMTYREYLEKLFTEAKLLDKDYYYKEYERFSKFDNFNLRYKGSIKNKFNEYPQLDIFIKKGKMTSIIDSEISYSKTEIIEHNGKKYLKEDNCYYTYCYIDDQLWIIKIVSSLTEDEIFKIMESIEN